MYHFYHIYADGHWGPCLEDHLTALRDSGLANKLDSFHIGVVGASTNRNRLYQSIDLDYQICAEADQGWEQVTLAALHAFAQKHDGPVLYAHTKGAANPDTQQDQWRRSMTQHLVGRWNDNIAKLSEYDAVGCHRLVSSNNIIFFGGNFWWTHLEIIRRLPPPLNDNRWQAEEWLGLYPNLRTYDWLPGAPHHFYWIQ